MFGFAAYVATLSPDRKSSLLRGRGFQGERVSCQAHKSWSLPKFGLEQECVVIRGFNPRTDNLISIIYPLSVPSAIEAFLAENDSFQILAIFPVKLQNFEIR